VEVPLEVLEAATIRHYTSRANDPHRHLHLQFLSRVFAVGKWRGLHTVGVRDVINAINGIGHAAMDTDPELNAALAVHGYTKNATGEIRELAEYVGQMSARAGQIVQNMGRYEREWAVAHPDETPGLALRRSWHHRARAEGRPDKVIPQAGANLDEQWRAELHDLGFRISGKPVPLTPTPVGALNRDELVERALARLAAGRSAWNPADIRGEVERLIAGAGVVVAAGVRIELAEDLTTRAMGRCVPLLAREGVPEHIRAWTSTPVLDVETELTTRLAARAAVSVPGADLTLPFELAAGAERLHTGQAAAVAALAGDPLLVVEGAAGSGKTTTLAATCQLLEEQGHRLVVVTPTLKAAKVAAAEVGAAAGSAAWLTYQHGWRWDDDGTWTRLAVGDTDPATGHVYTGPNAAAPLRPGDLLVVDEAGMLNQDTARALLTLADESQVRLALLGDRHQLPAVGRGGVLDLAVGQIDAHTYLRLDGVHRFVRTDATGRTKPDTDYADLTLAMRTGDDPGKVFDALLARGQIRLHPNAEARQEKVAATAASYPAGEPVALVVNTGEQAAELNAAIRDRLVATGRVDDRHVAITAAGERIGAGDQIATRRNDRNLGVANRDTWIVTAVDHRGGLLVIPAVTPTNTVTGDGPESVTPADPGPRVLPADYVTAHVELAYASTAHGAQGDTVTAAHLVVGEHTGAASAYVGMTRGREANTAHLVAADIEEAREQWVAVFARDRADLGPAHAAELAAAEAARYALPRPLDDVLAELRLAWDAEQHCLDRLAFYQPQRDTLREVVTHEAPHAGELAKLEAARERTAAAAAQAAQRAEASASVITAESDRIRDGLLRSWDGDRGAAQSAAKIVLDGPGRLGLRRGAVARASEQLTDWANGWRQHLPGLPTDTTDLARMAGWFDDRPALWTAFNASARAQAEQAHPDHATLSASARATEHAYEQARSALAEARRQREGRPDHLGPAAWVPGPGARLAELERNIAVDHQKLTAARTHIAGLKAEPALLAQPADRLTQERDGWRARQNAEGATGRTRAATPIAAGSAIRTPPPPPPTLGPRPGSAPWIGR
jgi:exodeoxyribonuclease V alpha subunit